MKQLFIILLGILFSALSFAANPDKRLVVTVGEGVAEYAIKSIRSLKFSNGAMLLNMHDGSVIECDTESVSSLLIEEYTPSEETNIGCIESEPALRFNRGVLHISGFSSVDVQLFNPSGSILYSESFNGDGIVNLSSYPKGVYMLNVNGRTYKIINR